MALHSLYCVTLKNIFTNTNLIHATSGGLGSVFAISVFYPLETTRTRLQVDDHRVARYSPFVIREILTEEGISGLYRGWFSLVSSLFLTNFVYFYVFHGLKTLLLQEGVAQNYLKDLVFGMLAGTIAVILTNPLWVVNTRLKLQGAKFKSGDYKSKRYCHYSGIIDCLYKICKYEGVKTLWSGTSASLLLVSNPAIQFMVYETLKRNLHFLFIDQDLCGGVIYFIYGAVAKLVATLVTYPLQVVQTRVRAGFDNTTETGKGIGSSRKSLRWRSLRTWYRGLESKLTQTVLTAALMLFVYEKISAVVFALVGQSSRVI